MGEHFNKLSPEAAERIAMLMEEAGEVVQICGKILRHGLNNHHPDNSTPNSALLRREITDFLAVAHACRNKEFQGFPGAEETANAWQKKLKYAHHQGGDNG